jgi:hypothetical protein
MPDPGTPFQPSVTATIRTRALRGTGATVRHSTNAAPTPGIPPMRGQPFKPKTDATVTTKVGTKRITVKHSTRPQPSPPGQVRGAPRPTGRVTVTVTRTTRGKTITTQQRI